jgi:hypothetical protein
MSEQKNENRRTLLELHDDVIMKMSEQKNENRRTLLELHDDVNKYYYCWLCLRLLLLAR